VSDIVTSRIFTDGERGITATKLNDIIGGSTIQPAFYTSKPTAGTADPADIALILKAGAYAQVPISALAGSATQAQIWSTRLRSFNAIGNPNFEVDQKLCGAVSPTMTPTVAANIDRWSWKISGSATLQSTAQQTTGNVVIPGYPFIISAKFFRVTLTTAQASLGANDALACWQFVEGPQLRELLNDVHSVSILARSSVANLNFGLVLRDSGGTRALAKLCSLGAANTWTLVTLPNLPVWPSGIFNIAPGAPGYSLFISLAAGASQLITPDVWQSTAMFGGVVGQANFAASPVNSTFDIAFVQHEPGAVCSILMDKPFSQNLDECQRYYQKTWDYSTAVGTASNNGTVQMFDITSTVALNLGHRFKKSMAKAPTCVAYAPSNGAVNSANNRSNMAVVSVSSFQNPTAESPCYYLNTGGPLTTNDTMMLHYTADTGW
jgi:hypothetical protein